MRRSVRPGRMRAASRIARKSGGAGCEQVPVEVQVQVEGQLQVQVCDDRMAEVNPCGSARPGPPTAVARRRQDGHFHWTVVQAASRPADLLNCCSLNVNPEQSNADMYAVWEPDPLPGNQAEYLRDH
jgi:hypothetical protein